MALVALDLAGLGAELAEAEAAQLDIEALAAEVRAAGAAEKAALAQVERVCDLWREAEQRRDACVSRRKQALEALHQHLGAGNNE